MIVTQVNTLLSEAQSASFALVENGVMPQLRHARIAMLVAIVLVLGLLNVLSVQQGKNLGQVLRFAIIARLVNLVALDLRLVTMVVRREPILALDRQLAMHVKRGRILSLKLSFVRNVKNVESENSSQRLVVLALIQFAKYVPPERLHSVAQLLVIIALIPASILQARVIQFVLLLEPVLGLNLIGLALKFVQ